MPRSLLAVVACITTALVAPAADPPAVSTTHADLDKLAVEVLKDLHNRGADLYNAADATGAVRLYEATLRAVGPFLAHRPKVQAVIANGLSDAFKLDGAKAQAYRLHELIDQVRTDLKAGTKPDGEKKPDPPAVAAVSGVLTLDGQPVPKADVTLVSLTLPRPRAFTAATDIDGKFAFADLPPATYAVMVTGGVKPLPSKYDSTRTSGLELVVKSGPQATDVNLQSK